MDSGKLRNEIFKLQLTFGAIITVTLLGLHGNAWAKDGMG